MPPTCVRVLRARIRLRLFRYLLLMHLAIAAILYNYNGSNTEVVIMDNNHNFRQKDIKWILFWRLATDDNMRSMETEFRCIKECPVKCVVTDEKESIGASDAVTFELTSLWPDNWNVGTRKTIKFPPYRRPDQVWIVMNQEPPANLFGDLRVFNGLFNWTAWYRKDSTLFLPYGGRSSLNKTESSKVIETLQKRSFHQEKQFETIGLISNCADAGRRYKIISELQKYTPVDMFGKCYDKVCGDPHDLTTCDFLLRKYKFYLAFENSNCKDYVTEKYWSALKRDQIPIVNWNNVNKDIVVPNSYINIHDFKDIRSLADYINSVSQNRTLYNSYFEWKKLYKDSPYCLSCQICKALHDEKRPSQVIANLDSWVRNDTCRKVEWLNNWIRNLQRSLFRKYGI